MPDIDSQFSAVYLEEKVSALSMFAQPPAVILVLISAPPHAAAIVQSGDLSSAALFGADASAAGSGG
jgi:hypothetical protein